MGDPVRIDLVVDNAPVGVDPVTVVTNALAAHGCTIAPWDPDGVATWAAMTGQPLRHWTPITNEETTR